MQVFSDIRKRDGRRVPFDIDKIVSAIGRAFGDTGETADERTCRALAGNVVEKLSSRGWTCLRSRRYRTRRKAC